MQSAIATVHRYAGNGRQLDDPTLGRQRTKRRRAAIAATTAEAIAELLVDLGPDPFEQWADVEWGIAQLAQYDAECDLEDEAWQLLADGAFDPVDADEVIPKATLYGDAVDPSELGWGFTVSTRPAGSVGR